MSRQADRHCQNKGVIFSPSATSRTGTIFAPAENQMACDAGKSATMPQRQPASDQGGALRLVAIEEHYATQELLAATGLDVSWLPGAVGPGCSIPPISDWPTWTPPGSTYRCSRRSDLRPKNFRRKPPCRWRAHSTPAFTTRVVARWPDRFSAFATLPTGDPDAAAAELEYAVTELRFVGALINGTTGGRFLDHPDFNPILETAAKLNVPIYLHPGAPPAKVAESVLRGLEAGGRAHAWHGRLRLALRNILARTSFGGFRGVRPSAHTADHPGSSRRGHPVPSLPNRGHAHADDRGAAQARRPILPRQLLDHHQRVLLRRPDAAYPRSIR